MHTGIAHLSQNARGLPAAASGLAVYEYRGIFSGNQTADTAQRLKGNIDASGNMSLLIFLGSAYIYKYGAGSLAAVVNGLVNIGSSQKAENRNGFSSCFICYFIMKSSVVI